MMGRLKFNCSTSFISAKSSASTNTAITRTGLLSSMKSSRHSDNSGHCPRSACLTKRLISYPRRIITAARCFQQPGSKAKNLNASICFPLFTQQRTFRRMAALRQKRPYSTGWKRCPQLSAQRTQARHCVMSEVCRYCCKSRKLHRPEFLVKP